jgi:sulfatase modifying factor 1
MKNALMYNKHSIGKPIIELNRNLWDYEYHTSQSVFPNGMYKKSNPILTPFDYKGIKFSMITCPAGGKIDIEKWGSQEIKEPFMLGETEVTQGLFFAVMGFSYSKFKTKSKGPNKNPVEMVSWYDCIEFCNRLSDYFGLDHCYVLKDKIFCSDYGYPLSINKANVTFIEWANGFRLPREWEWQIAAMAGTRNKYAGANDDESLKRVAWFDKNSGDRTHPVARKLPNEWGFYDMSGNVSEWCENSYVPDNNKVSSADRAIRGGRWSGKASISCSAFRYNSSPDQATYTRGFRVARSI